MRRKSKVDLPKLTTKSTIDLPHARWWRRVRARTALTLRPHPAPPRVQSLWFANCFTTESKVVVLSTVLTPRTNRFTRALPPHGSSDPLRLAEGGALPCKGARHCLGFSISPRVQGLRFANCFTSNINILPYLNWCNPHSLEMVTSSFTGNDRVFLY